MGRVWEVNAGAGADGDRGREAAGLGWAMLGSTGGWGCDRNGKASRSPAQGWNRATGLSPSGRNHP